MNKITICLLVLQIFLLNAYFSSAASGYQKSGLKLSNKYRAKHGSPALKLDSSLSKKAVKCANYLASGNSGQCPQAEGYGINVSGGWSSTGAPSYSTETSRGIKFWYAAIKNYNFGNPNPANYLQTGTFTQLVWKGSRKVGIGCASNKNTKWTRCVSLYSPGGNINTAKYYKANVLRSG